MSCNNPLQSSLVQNPAANQTQTSAIKRPSDLDTRCTTAATSIQPSSRPTTSEDPYRNFEKELNAWTNDSTITVEERKERESIAGKIRNFRYGCYGDNTTLVLCNFEHITSLPEKALALLTNLEELNINTCKKLTSIATATTLLKL